LDRIQALLGIEWLALRRDPWTTLSLGMTVLVIGALSHIGPFLPKATPPPVPDEHLEAPAWPCQPGHLGPVAAQGEVPDWLRWPDPLVAADEAEVLLRFGPPTTSGRVQPVDVVPLVVTARSDRVRACLDDRLSTARRASLDALGISESPERFVQVRSLDPAEEAGTPPERPTSAPLGAAMAGGLFLLLVSLYLELGPRSRASGWVEAWLVLPGERSDLVWAWWLVGVIAGTLGVGLVLVGSIIGAFFSHLPGHAPPWPTVPAMVVLASALGLRAFMDVDDMRTAIARSMPLIFGVTVLGGVALLAEDKLPGLGALVPVAGLGLAMADRTSQTGTGLAVVSALVTTGLLLVGAIRTLEATPARLGAMSRTAARRARGDYRPEVVLLTLVAMAGSTSWIPPKVLNDDLVLTTLVSMLAFLAVPTVGVSGPLGLERGPLLSWRAPPARAWLLLPLVVCGTLGGASLLWQGALALQPESALTEAFAQGMQAFSSPLGLVVVSVLPGICEELLFRGAILGLLRKGLPDWASVLIQALLFALLHGLAVRFPYTLGIGLVLGLVVVRTGSLWPVMVAHAAHNLVATLAGDHLPGADSPLPWIAAAVGLAAAWATGAPRHRDPRG